MKKYALLMIVQSLMYALSFAQKPIILYQGNEIIMYNTSEIDSITHSYADTMIVYLGKDLQEYSANQIDSVSFSVSDNVIYEISSDMLNDWDAGWILSNRICLLNKVDTLNTENLAYFFFLEDGNETNSFAVKYDNEGKLVSIESIDESFYFTYDYNVIIVHSVNKDGVIEEFSYPVEQSNHARAIRAPSADSNNNALANSYVNLQNFLNNYADKLANSDTPYLRYFAEELRTLPENLMRDGIVKGLSKLLGKRFDLVNIVLKYLEDNDKRRVAFGDCYVSISGITESDKHHYINGSLQNINQLPSYGDISTELKYGILSKYYGSGNDRNLPTVYWNDNKWEWVTNHQYMSINISQKLPKMSFGWYGFRAFEERFGVVKYCGYYWYFNPDLEETPEYEISNVQSRYIGNNQVEVSFTCSFNPISTDILLYQGIELKTKDGEKIVSFGAGNYTTTVKKTFDTSLFEKDYTNFIATLEIDAQFWYVPHAIGKTYYKALNPKSVAYTQKPKAKTGDKITEEQTSVVVKCKYEDYGFWNAICGIEYGHNGSTQYKKITPTDDNEMSITLTGLTPNTTYQYRAYFEVKGKKEYGEYKSFKTKKNENPTPIAITGAHKNELMTSATIECTYKYVPDNADCGYYISKSYHENVASRTRISGGIEWDKVSVGRFEGTKEISLDNLMPDEEYQYYAYISVGNEDVAIGTTKIFTTKTPIANITGEAQTTITSATVGYGFENVPDGGSCQLILLKVGDPLQNARFIPVPNTTNDSYTFTGLEGSTSYQYMARIEYKTRKWDSSTGSFTTQVMPTPIAITGGHYNETLNSATIECTYEQIPSGADCGYYLRGQKGSLFILNISENLGNVSGTQVISLNDLKPGATYYYQAFVQYQGREYLGAESSFQTLTPSAITGGYSNVTSNKASIVCGYFNVPSGATTGVKLSYNGETHDMPYNYGEGEHNIDINGLYPGTSYAYSAYIKYEDETYEGDTKRFTTLTPTAYVGNATNVEEKTAQFEYGFSNVPEGGTCHIALQQEGGETYDYSASDIEQDIFQLSGLQPSTTYTYWAYVDYYGEKWNSSARSFTTKTPPTPIATTGDYSNVTMTSATVYCTYENVPEGGICGVEYKWDGGSSKMPAGSGNGARSITLSGLQPITTYTYCAYIEADGQTYYGVEKKFTTNPPDLSGIWKCTSYTERGTVYETWTIIFNKDGSGSASNGSNTYNDFSWEVGAGGSVNFGFFLINQSYGLGAYNSRSFQGVVNSLYNPTSISGKGQYNQGNAIVDNYSEFTFVMTR